MKLSRKGTHDLWPYNLPECVPERDRYEWQKPMSQFASPECVLIQIAPTGKESWMGVIRKYGRGGRYNAKWWGAGGIAYDANYNTLQEAKDAVERQVRDEANTQRNA